MTADPPVIAVDGPSGTGKGTLCSELAHWLDWYLLDSGALYRVLALVAERNHVALDAIDVIIQLTQNMGVEFSQPEHSTETKVILNGEDVSQAIRTENCGLIASQLAALPEVRKALLNRQRAFRREPGLVADGRDMGTVVFPDAILKIFLTASAGIRAQRRHKQLKEKGFDVNLAQLSEDITERDNRDSQRNISPLKAAEDAVIIDTTGLTVNQVMERVSTLVRERFSSASNRPVDR